MDIKYFGDVTLAWEDEQRKDVWNLQVRFEVNDFDDVTLALEDAVWDKGQWTSRKSESENFHIE